MILKKYFFLINLLILFALGFLSARFVNLLIERKLAAGWQLGGQVKPKGKTEGAKKVIPDKESFKLILERPVFRSVKKESRGPATAEVESCPLSNYTPVGTISGEGMSYVLIADTSGKVKLYKPGQSVDSMRIVRVERKAVVLIACGKEQRIMFKEKEKEGQGARKPLPGSSESLPPPTTFNPNGIKQDSKDHYSIERSVVDEALSNMNQLLTQARIIPHFKAGKANGFQVINIVPNSIYDKLGLVGGDILKSLNGNDLKTMEDAMGIFTNLKNMSHITLTIERGSEKKTMNYDIR